MKYVIFSKIRKGKGKCGVYIDGSSRFFVFFSACSSQSTKFQEIEPGSIYKGEITINEPSSSNEVVLSNGQIEIDASNTSDGYVMVRRSSL